MADRSLWVGARDFIHTLVIIENLAELLAALVR